MRQILFRGKRADNGRWAEGYYICLNDVRGNGSHRIYTGYAETDCGDFYPDWVEVDPQTVGQYTGVNDKTGKRIFEGDIVLDKYKREKFGEVGEIIFVPERTAFELRLKQHPKYVVNVGSHITSLRVIGNIYDNPELLEEREEKHE